jgi:hypothetical protein
MKSYVDDAGRWQHQFGASWLKTAQTCLERARREHTGEMDNIESDAACVGTAVHLGIEVCLESGGLTLADQLEVAQDEFSRLMLLDGTNGDPEARHKEGVFTWVKYDERQARNLIATHTANWYHEVLPDLDYSAHTEWTFGDEGSPEVVLWGDDTRTIRLAGAVDYLDRNGAPKDWKTAGQAYRKWEYDRWGMQPTVYSYAINYVHGRNLPFEYVVMHPKGVQRFTVERDERHLKWLATQCVDLAIQIEHNIPSWPKSDNHALCSEKWCPAWRTCKGASGITFK